MKGALQEIIGYVESLGKYENSFDLAVEYCNKYDVTFCKNRSYAYCMAFDLIERVRKAVAGDPEQWFLYDANGNELHIGSKVECMDQVKEVRGFYGRNIQLVLYGEPDLGDWDLADTAQLIIPDTREDVIKDLTASLLSSSLTEAEAANLANMYVERLMALKEAE